jgi:hypothetical protein
MEKIGIEDYYAYISYNYFKIDYDKFLKENLPIYKDDDNRGVIRLEKSDYLRGKPGSQMSAFYDLLEKQNANKEWDFIEVKDLPTLFKIFTLIGDNDEDISFNLMSKIPIYYRKGIVTICRKKELSFKPEKLMSHPNRDLLFELLSSDDKANIELALILINNG